MIIPKVLAQNSGFDPQDVTVKLQVVIDIGLILLCVVYWLPIRKSLLTLDN